MGVDIQTYRGRIGCFNRNLGTDVLTTIYIAEFTRGLKTIGAVVFIGILLLLAGIEQNPGPISESTSKRTPAHTTILKVCGLPKGTREDSLLSFFKNLTQPRDGNVLRVHIDENDLSALVEFDEAETLQLVLKEKTIKIDDKDVSIEIYFDESSVDENNSSQIDNADEVFEDITSDEELGSDYEHVNRPSTVTRVVSYIGRTITKGLRKRFDFFKSTAISGVQDTFGSNKEIFWQMLETLGLIHRYPGTISIRDIVVVDDIEWNEKENGSICFTDIPWLVLKRLISSQSDVRDVSVTIEHDFNNGIYLENTLSSSSTIPDDKQDISPLDVFYIIFQCCDPFLKQVLVQKLYLCKLAVPFLYKYWETKEKQVSVLSVWPLRSLAIENKQTNDRDSEGQCKEIDILELPKK
ncbi:uncharacterized protein LOC132734741 [Ruditapes philippinarum]|uniref:uncharacterized protein LOC132734741 n=1 Tax=Ruditapes philippinarum TaxID=129788 RepID=UPI00295B7F49|nr:uncharacterized protein LOC132734741 [Ruditapes philippinarum]